MAPFKQIPSLIHSSRQILANEVFVVSKKFLCDGTNFDSFTEYIETLSLQLSNFLGQNNPNIAPLWLDIAQNLSKFDLKEIDQSSDDEEDFLNTPKKDGKELKIRFVIDSLVCKAALFHIERFIFGAWSKKVETSFLNYIWKATDLQCLEFKSGWDRFLDKKIDSNRLLNRLPFLTNLTDFTADFCSNELIVTLCKNCKSLESLRLGSCKENCTNESIYSLASLKKLQNLDLAFLSVEDLITLLLNSQSDNLQDITYNVDCFSESIDINYFLRRLARDVVPFRTFNLRRICCDELKGHLLKKIPKYFPHLESICFMNPVHNLPDLSILNCLKNLKTVHLHSLGMGHSWKDLWSLQTPLLTKLSIAYYYEDEDDYLIIEPDTFLEFGLNCPNLQSVVLNQCSFSSHSKTTHFSGKRFQNLKLLKIETTGPSSGVEIILSHAPNIEEIDIAFSSKCSDEFFDCIYQSNPLSELKKLRFDLSEVSTEMLKFLIRRCPRINCLKHVSYATNTYEHSELKKFISENNYDVSL